MQIDRVTITGADDSVAPHDLIDLSRRYPFVEWGILFSPKAQGVSPRYPTWDWVNDLRSEYDETGLGEGIDFCAHICGGYARDIFAGSDETLKKILGENGMFYRAQLNGYTSNLHSEYMQVVVKHPNVDFILQCGTEEALTAALVAYRTSLNINAIYDPSGGKGERPAGWPEPPDGLYTGYAGGIGPDNVKDVLRAVSRLKNTVPGWIDMETRVRSNDDKQFDLAKVETVLKKAVPFIS
jgi:hypothetical protein